MAILATNLINGEKPVFGNPEHIKFCRQAEWEAEQKDIEPDQEVRVFEYEKGVGVMDVEFDCLKCSYSVTVRISEPNFNAKALAKKTHLLTCSRCRTNYAVEKGVVRLQKNIVQ